MSFFVQPPPHSLALARPAEGGERSGMQPPMMLQPISAARATPPGAATTLPRLAALRDRLWAPVARRVRTWTSSLGGWARRNEAWIWLVLALLFTAVFLYVLATSPAPFWH